MLTSAPEPGSPLAIRLLGPFHAEVEGKPLPRLRSRKGEWLLALLVLRGDRPQRRDWLAETLWPENRPEDALASLRQSVKDLRAALGDQSWRLGPPGGRTLQLDLAGAWVDLLAFDECVHKGDPDSQARAARLYAGPVLEGCSESWVLAEREQREQAYLHALEWLARDAEARGDRRAAAGYLRRAAAVSPQSGALLRALMVTLAEAGELHAAVEAYQEHRRHLYVDWNAEPEPETTALFRRLRAGDYTRLPTAEQTPVLAHAVPGSLSPLLGRERELMEVEGKLLTGRLVTLTGPGGVGKTRLALAAAAEAGRHFAGGAAFIELAAVRHPTQLPTAISAGLGLEPTAATTGELIGALSGRQLLLVLDNCEHVLAASAQAAHALVSGCPGLRILATSRERLGVTGEIVQPLAPLAVPPDPAAALSPPDLDRYPATRLFCERAAQVLPDFAPSAGEQRLIAHLCARLDGLPLAIELAAALVDSLSVQQIADRLEGRLDLLQSHDPARPDRHRTLEAVVAWSHAGLEPAESALFRRLSVFVGGWSIEAAEAVCADPPGGAQGLASTSVLPVLMRLARKSLVVWQDTERAGRRYRMLETIREYARQRLEAAGEAEPLEQRRLDWLAARAEAAARDLTGRGQCEALARLDVDYPNLQAALTWGLGMRAPAAAARAGAHLALALGRYWQIRGLFADGCRQMGRALQHLPAAPEAPHERRLRARLLGWSGFLALYLSEYASAREWARSALALWDTLEDDRGRAEAIGTLAIAAKDQGERETARSLFLESRSLWERAEDRQGIATTDGYLGILAAAEGEHDAAARLYEQALAHRRALGDTWGIAASLNNLGLLALSRGDLAAARPLLEESLSLRRELGDRRSLAITLNSLGRIALRKEGAETAARYYTESLELTLEIGDRRSVAYSLEAIGGLEISHGDPAAGVRLLAAASRLREEISVPLSASDALTQEQAMEEARSALGAEATTRCWQEGRLRELPSLLALAQAVVRRYSSPMSSFQTSG